MKLIQILALATAMATMATAQNANNQNKGKAAATPSPTPVGATKSGSKPPTTTKTPVVSASHPDATKTGTQTAGTKPATAAVTATKPISTQKSASKTAAPGPNAAATPSPKPTVKSGSLPEKTKATKSASGTIKATHAPVDPLPAKASTKSTVQPKVAVAPVKSKPLVKTQKSATTTQKSTVTKKTTGAGPAKSASPTVKEMGRPATAEKTKPSAKVVGAHGRRDPFVSPIRNLGNVTPAPPCTSGKRCLSIPELVLQGTVKDLTGKMLAVVANSSHHTYFLRENDQVFNGSVEKITSDSIIFREFVKDALGRESAREVVKKLVPTT